MTDDPDLLEDFLAFLYATEEPREFYSVQPGETIICTSCGRELDEDETYSNSSNGEVQCTECKPE